MIDINYEDIEPISILEDELSSWLEKVCEIEGKQLEAVSLVFCSDNYLLAMNQEYLNHDYFTDIITFDYCDEDLIIGDLFISLDRVSDNANSISVEFRKELFRVIVHGVLHLIGFGDKTEDEEKIMRSKEDQMLKLIGF